MRLSAAMISSTMPSAKYSCSGSPDMFWNGSTAIDGLSGSGSAGSVAPTRAGALPPPARKRGRVRVGAFRSHPVDPNRPGEILQALLADIGEGAIEAAVDLVVDDAGDADPVKLGDPLQPRGDVDAVAVNVAVFDDHITRVDADAELDARVLGGGIVACCHP